MTENDGHENDRPISFFMSCNFISGVLVSSPLLTNLRSV